MRDNNETAYELSRRLADEARERQRLQDMCEDSGLVFMLPEILNPYARSYSNE